VPLKPRDMIDASDPRVCQIGHPAPPWMVNYADLMTELVCLFVIMYGLSGALSKPIQDARKEVEDVILKKDIPGNVMITKDGLVISLEEQDQNVFFEVGSADLTDNMKGVLDQLAPALLKLAEKRHDLIVEGHTDDVPIRTPRFNSNWELSTARSTAVVQYLLSRHKYPANLIGAVGYGENKAIPRAKDEDLVAWRAKNRRVVFVFKNPEKLKTPDEPATPAKS
jgi:chemotaxis protein MotB